MVSLKDLTSFSTFAEIIRETRKDYINAIFAGQPLAIDPAANYKVYWSFEDLSVPHEQALVKKFYDLLGLTSKVKFAQLYTESEGEYNKNNVWLPSISINPDTGKLALYVGFTAIDIEHDTTTGDFTIPTYPNGSDVAVLEFLEIETKTVKLTTGEEVRRAEFQLTIDEELDEFISFPIRLIDNKDERLAKVIKGRKKDQIAKTVRLIAECVAVSKLSTQSDICNINKLLLSVFQSDKPFKPVAIPFTGWIYKTPTEKQKFPSIHISVDTSHIVEMYGDFEVLDFYKNPVKVSNIRKITIGPGSSSSTYFVNHTSKTDVHIPFSGVMLITAKGQRVEYAPSFIVQEANSLSPELLAKYNIKPNLMQELPGHTMQPAKALSPNMASTDEIDAYQDTQERTSDEHGVDAITYDDLQF